MAKIMMMISHMVISFLHVSPRGVPELPTCKTVGKKSKNNYELLTTSIITIIIIMHITPNRQDATKSSHNRKKNNDVLI